MKPGVYHYLCTVHQGMRGTVRVLARAHPANPVAVARHGANQLAAVLRELKGLDKQTPPTRRPSLSEPALEAAPRSRRSIQAR